MDIYRLIFVDILIPIVTLVLGFFGGKIYQIKIVQKRNENKTNSVVGTDNTAGDGNESIKRDKISVSGSGHKVSGDNSTTIIASGDNAQAAGRDIVNGEQNKRKR